MLSFGHCVSRGILGAVNIQLPYVDPLRLQLPASPSVLHPAVCRICHQLLFPWMHSHIRHMQTLAAVLSPVCKQCWRTASLCQLRSLGGLLIPSLGYHCAVSQAAGPSLVSRPDCPVSHSPVGTRVCAWRGPEYPWCRKCTIRVCENTAEVQLQLTAVDMRDMEVCGCITATSSLAAALP